MPEEKVCYKCYTTCRIEKECRIRYETRKRCYTVCEEKVCYIPYTTCHASKECHYRCETKKHCYTVCEKHVKYVPYTVCRMVPETCIKYEYEEALLHDQGDLLQGLPLYRLPHGQGAMRQVRVPQALLQGAGRERLPHPVHDLPDGEGSLLQDREVLQDALGAGGKGLLRAVHDLPHGRGAADAVRTEDDVQMEPYCHTYQTCRMVPVCEEVCESPCVGLPPAHVSGNRVSGRSCRAAANGATKRRA